MRHFGTTLFAFALTITPPAAASDFYSAPNGSPSGDGSKANAWDLATALAQPVSVKPGDTIWLRGGTYVGHFTSSLKGQPNNPITVRQYPGERVSIDGNDGTNDVTLAIQGSYTWFWGLEILNSNPSRVSQTASPPPGRGPGVHIYGVGTRLVNMIIHDTGQGVLFTTPASASEIYGSLIYFNGYDGTDRGHGHGIYVQNDTGNKKIVDNLIFDQFGYGIHAYTAEAKLDNLYFEGNVVFDNGSLSNVSGFSTNILVGASGTPATDPTPAKVAKNTRLLDNLTFFPGNHGVAANLGYSKGIASPVIVDNYFIGRTALTLINAFRPVTMTGNTLYGAISGFGPSEFPSNTYRSTRPTGVNVFVRRNRYESGRASITIYNWDRADVVNVNVEGLLTAGTHYELRNAQNFFGPAIFSGTYEGGLIHVPMNALTPASPVGHAAPPTTGPDFAALVLLPKSPPSNERKPVASFSFSPRAPRTNESVSFTDHSIGSVTARIWDFGDTASGPDNVSSLAGPTHVFTNPGTHIVRLITTNGGGTSVRFKTVTVSEPLETQKATLPVAGHVVGATGATFVTDVAVQNPTMSSVDADLIFFQSGAGPPIRRTVSFAPAESRAFSDIVAELFGLTNAIGSLEVSTAGGPVFRVAGRTYVQQSTATLGLGTVGLPSTDMPSGPQYLANLSTAEGFRTNLGALNPTGATQTLRLDVRSQEGLILGRTSRTLGPGEQRQWGLSELFPGTTGIGLTVRVTSSSFVAPFVYAAVVDNASSDPAHYSARQPAPFQYLPGIAAVSGVGGAFFRSEISIVNSEEGPTTVVLTFLEHDRDNSTAPSRTLVLAPTETFHTDDALTTLFGISNTYGALKIESHSAPGVVAFERILTDSTMTPGTVGQQVDSVGAEDLFPSGVLLGLRQDSAFRSNIGLFNPNPVSAVVTLRLSRAPVVLLDSTVVSVPPQGYVQRNIASLFSSASFTPGEVFSVAVDAGALPIAAFASVIDNVSQDPTFYAEQR